MSKEEIALQLTLNMIRYNTNMPFRDGGAPKPEKEADFFNQVYKNLQLDPKESQKTSSD